MSRHFDGLQQINHPPAVFGGLPATLAAWVNRDNDAAVMGVASSEGTTVRRGVFMYVDDLGFGNGFVVGFGDGGGIDFNANGRYKGGGAGSANPTGAWVHLAGVIRGAVDMDTYANGVAVNVGLGYMGAGGAYAEGGGFDGLIGTISNAFGDFKMTGYCAEVGFWAAALTAAEVAALARGVPPSLVRPGTLRAYWPLYGVAFPEPDLSGRTGVAGTPSTIPIGNPAFRPPAGRPTPSRVVPWDAFAGFGVGTISGKRRHSLGRSR